MTIQQSSRVGYRDLVVDAPTDFRVHSKAYKDPQVFQDEVHAIFEKTWVYLCHESEVANPGDYRTSLIGTTPVVIARSEAGQINVVVNTCRHRANAVCRDASGNSANFRCRYHGWVFKNSGELIGVADRRRFPPDFTTEDLGLLKVPHVASYRGLIFACMDRGVPMGLDEYLGETKKYIDAWADRSPGGPLQVKRPHRYSYNGNWKFQSENSNDGYHGGFTHESNRMTMEHFGLTNPDRGFQKVSQGGIARGFPYGHGTFEGGFAGKLGLTDSQFKTYWDALVRQHGEKHAREVIEPRHLLIFPNVILMTHNIRVVHPIAPDYTEVDSYFVAMRGVPDEVNMGLLADLQRRLGTTGMIAPDDVEMFAANQTGLKARDMEWLVLRRGLGKETAVSPGEWHGVASDETPMRSIYKEWLRLMAAYEDGAAT